MMRASSLLRLSPLLLLTVAAAVLFSGGAPAEAQDPATVTRWVGFANSVNNIRAPAEVRAGNYYKVLLLDRLENRLVNTVRIYEGNLAEIAIISGADSGIPDFSCDTHEGTAESNDYSSGAIPIDGAFFVASEDYVVTSPIATKSEQSATPPQQNVAEPIEYFEVECLPTGTGSNLWRADGSARVRIELIDEGTDPRLNSLSVKSSTDGTTFSSTSLTLSPSVSLSKQDTEFSAGAVSAVTHVKVRPMTLIEEATVTVNGVAVARGSDSAAIAITDGYTDIDVQVTAEDGTTTRDYTVTVKRLPAATLSDLEVLDEYGSLVTRPSFNAFYPEQSQVIYVAPGIRRIKVKPSWPAGATMTVTVSTTDMTYKNRTYSTDTVSTSGTESGYLTISSFGGTKLNISVTETIDGDSTTVEYTRKYVTRETNAANVDNYLDYIALSPNPNARPTSWLNGTGSSGYFNVLLRDWSAGDGAAPTFAKQTDLPWPALPMASSVYARALETYTPAVPEPQRNTASITLTPAFDPEVHEYTATVPYEVSSVFVNLGTSHPKASATVNGNSPSTPVGLDVGENVVEVVVTAESGVRRTYTVTITREPSNRPPTVSSAISDAALSNESATHEASLSNVFSDPDADDLTVTATSSDKSVATVSVSDDYSTLTVSAQARGTATITVNAADGKGGSVDDAFNVTVKSAPVAASSIADVSALEVDATQEVSLSAVFSDADGDALTITAASSDEGKATVSVSADQSTLTVSGVSEGTATITVTARDSDGNTARGAFDVTVVAPPNNAPTVSSAIADATIVDESGTSQVSLSGVFSDPDSDDLRVTASSSDENVATVSVASDDSTLTVTAKSRGAANITVAASDGKGGEVSDTFAVTVKSAPVVASSIADVSALEVEATHEVSLSGVFSDADGDSLTITASSSAPSIATASTSADYSSITVAAKSEGAATITVTAQDADGNTASDAFDVTVNAPAQPEPIEPQPIESEPQSEQEPQLQQQAAQLPGAVTNLTVEPRNTRIIVSWEAPTEGGTPTGYIAHIKPVGGGDGHTMTPDADKTTIQFRRLNRETEYRIWVRAVNEEGKGERTPIRTATK